MLPVWCHPVSARSGNKDIWRWSFTPPCLCIPIEKEAAGPALPPCSVPGPTGQGTMAGIAQAVCIRTMCLAHTWEGTGWPCGFCSGGSWESLLLEGSVWWCKNEPVLESTSQRGTVFCPCKHWCAESITEHHLGRDKPWYSWWHMQATSHTSMSRRTEESLFIQWATSSSSAPDPREGDASGSRGTKHRAPTFPLCLSCLKRPWQSKPAFISHLPSKGIVSYLLFIDTSPSDRAPLSRLAEAGGGVCFLSFKSQPFKIAQPLTQLYLASITTNRLLVCYDPSRQAKCLC